MVNFLYTNESVIRLGIFLGGFVSLALMELVSPIRALTQSKSHRWVSNISLIVIGTIVLRVFLPVAAVGVAYLSEQNHWGVSNHLDIPLWVKVILAFIVLDLMIYFQHMIFHVMPFMWRFHRVHHSDLDCDVTTGVRFHPVEILISMLIKIGIIIALGAPVIAVILFEIVLNFMSMFTHSNITINPSVERIMRWFIVTPYMHWIHHSMRENETNSNFGFHISIWDRVFGTYMDKPRNGYKQLVIGLEQFREPEWQTITGMLKIPFSSGIGGYAINYRDSLNEEKLELARKLAEKNREKAEIAAELETYIQAIGEHALVSVTDIGGRIIEANRKFCETSGYTRHELIGSNHRIIKSGKHPESFYIDMWKTISSGKKWSGEVCNRAKNGNLYWVDSTIIPIKDEKGRIARYVSVRIDITERKRHEDEMKRAHDELTRANEELEKLTRIDGLTGISNRRHFDEAIINEINKMGRMGSSLTLVLCDIDYFKDYNDTYGHDMGDICLKKVAGNISSCFSRAGDLVARYGGEEFAVILPGVDMLSAQKLAEEMRKKIEDIGINHKASKVSNVVTVSVGFTSMVPDKDTTPSMFIERADKALYKAKDKGRNLVQHL